MIFLKNNYKDDGVIYATNNEIETLNVSDCYDSNGQQIGHDDAGDYITLGTAEMVDFANHFENDGEYEGDSLYSIGDYINAYDSWQLFNALNEHFEDVVEHTNCQGFNVWDGHNWKSIIVNTQIGEPEWSIVDFDENELDDKEEVRTGNGFTVYETDKYEIISSQFVDAWETYSIIKK
jgi:hypothetical protein